MTTPDGVDVFIASMSSHHAPLNAARAKQKRALENDRRAKSGKVTKKRAGAPASKREARF